MEEISYHLFLEKIRMELPLYMKKPYQSCSFYIVREDGEAGLILDDKRSHLERLPCLAVKELYEAFRPVCTDNISSILSRIASRYQKALEEFLETEEQLSKKLEELTASYPKERLFITLSEVSEKIPAGYLYRKRGGSRILYGVLFSEEVKDEIRFCYIKAELLKHWKVSEEQLYYDACRNMHHLFPYHIEKKQAGYYLISNACGMYGGTAIFLKEGPLKELSMDLDSSLYVFLPSPHEAVAVDEGFGDTLKALAAASGREEFFFYYDKGLQELALNAVEKEEMARRRKNGVLDAAEKDLFEGCGL